MEILITNDDGYDAAGLAALVLAAREFGKVTVAAPLHPQSAMSHAITVERPLAVHEISIEGAHAAVAIDGKPADCVKLALCALLDRQPDLVLSGINAGLNVGMDVHYSGTVAGAREGRAAGIASVAFSQRIHDRKQFRPTAAAFEQARVLTQRIVGGLLRSAPDPRMLLSVNLPAPEQGPVRGLRVCPQRAGQHHGVYEATATETGQRAFRLVGRRQAINAERPDDHTLLEEGYVTVTPLEIDGTSHAELERISARVGGMDAELA